MPKPLHFEPRESSPLDFYAEALAQLRHKGLVESTARVGNNLSMYWRKA